MVPATSFVAVLVGNRYIARMKNRVPGASRPLKYVSTLLLALASSSAMALGLGDIRVLSKPGQPLLAEIPVISADPAELENLRVALASPVTFARVGLDRPTGLVSELQFELTRDANGRADGQRQQLPVLAVVVQAEQLPGHDADDRQHAEDGTQGDAGRHFAQRHLPPVAQAQFAQGQAADQQRGGLRTGIAAGAHDQRNEQREHHGAGQLVLVMLHGAGGEHFAEEQHAEPAGALAQHLEEADLHVRLFQRFHAAELVRVLGGFFDQRIQDVIHGDDAQHLLARIDHGNGEQVVATDQLSHFFLVEHGIDGHRRIDLGHLQDRLVRQAGDQPAHGDHLLQGLGDRVQHVDGVHGLAGALDFADVLQGAAHGPVGGHADEFGGHQRAGGVRRVAEQLLDGLARIGAEQWDQARAFVLVQLMDDVGGTVVGHQAQQRGGLGHRQRGHEVTAAGELGLFEHFHRARQRQRGQGVGGARQRQGVEVFHRVGGVEVLQGCTQGGGIRHRAQEVFLVHGVRLVDRDRATPTLANRPVSGGGHRWRRARSTSTVAGHGCGLRKGFAGRAVLARSAGGSLDPHADRVNPLRALVRARLKVIDARGRIIGRRRQADDAMRRFPHA